MSAREKLPARVDPRRLAAAGARLAGQLPLEMLPRLAERLAGSSGTVNAALQFGADAQGRQFIKGSVNTEVQLVCQRCLQTMPFTIEAELSLAIVTSEAEALRLPDGYEAVIVAGDTVDLPAVVEDELLLSLPFAPMHADSHCGGGRGLSSADPDTAAKDKPNPFAVLEQLKHKH